MSNQIVISSGAKVRELEGVLTGTAGVVNSLAINVPNGIPQLDGSGKILVSQLPNSVMEYKGTWNAATNTPTLANGTGNQGDVYLVSVAGTVNFGAGPIAFFVGDQVVYSGTIWQRASGATGTVTSVAVTESGDALSITGSPITTSGTINIGFSGDNTQYINGAGGLTTFPSLAGYLTAVTATAPLYSSGGTSPDITITQASSITDGFLDNADWTTFNNKQNAITLTTTGTTGAATLIGATLNIPNYSTDLSGYVTLGTTQTISGLKTFSNLVTIETASYLTSRLKLNNTATGGNSWSLSSGNQNNSTNNGLFTIINETLSKNTFVLGPTGKLDIGADLGTINPAFALSVYDTNPVLRVFDLAGNASSLNLEATNSSAFISAAYGTTAIPLVLRTGNTDRLTIAANGNSTFANNLTINGSTSGTTGSFASSGSGNTFAINHSSGSGISLNITKGGNGEGLYINKTSGSGNAVTIIGTLNATTLVKSGGTSSQFLKADGSVDSSTYLTTSSAASTYVPYTGATQSLNSSYGITGSYLNTIPSANNAGTVFFKTGTVFNLPPNDYSNIAAGDASDFRLYNTISSVTRGAIFSLSSITGGATRTYTLPNATGTLALTSDLGAYLPLAGGTLTGPLSVTRSITNFDNGQVSIIPSTNTSAAFFQVTNIGGTTYFGRNNNSGSFLPSAPNATLIYSTDSAPMMFFTNGNMIMTLTGGTTSVGGNVLINTTSDNGAKLQVSGAATFSSSVTATSAIFANSSVLSLIMGTPQLRLINNATATINQRVDLGLRWEDGTYNGIGGISMVRESATARLGRLVLSGINSAGDPNEAVNITGGGNVGIGTSSPSAALNVSGINVNAAIDWTNTTASTGRTFRWVSLNSGGFAIEDITAGTERMRITSGGNVGIGVIPSAWGTSVVRGFQVGFGASFSGNSSASDAYMTSNCYYDGSAWKYINTGNNALSFDARGNGGDFIWQNAPIGTAGGTVTFTERMRITSGGNVLIGTTTDNGARLQISGGNVTVAGGIRFSSSGSDANRWSVYWNGGTGDLIVVNNISDIRAKKDLDYNIKGLETIKKLKPLKFTWKDGTSHSTSVSGRLRQYGFIAQETMEADDYLAWHNQSQDTWGIEQYESFTAVIVKAIQEQQAQIEELKAKIK